MKILPTMLLIISLFGLLTSYSQSDPITLANANQAFFHMNPELAYSSYENVWLNTSNSINDRATAARRMATLSWLLYDNSAKAYEILSEQEELNFQRSEGYVVWSRILAENGNFDGSIRMATKALNTAASESAKYDSEMRLVKSTLDKYKGLVFNQVPANDKLISKELSEAFEVINRIMIEKPGDVLASDLYLGISLLTDKRQQAYDGWLSFYRSDAAGNVHATLQGAQQKLLAGLVEESDFSEKERSEQVILGLAESGFIEYAYMIARMNESIYTFTNSQVVDIQKYYSYLKEVDEQTITFYRATVIGEENEKKYQSALNDAAKSLWKELSWEKKPKFTNLQTK